MENCVTAINGNLNFDSKSGKEFKANFSIPFWQY